MHHLSRKNLSSDDLIKKTPFMGKEHHLNHHIVHKEKALKQNVLTEIKLEVCRIPGSGNGSPLQGF